jgi:hypothetical protein
VCAVGAIGVAYAQLLTRSKGLMETNKQTKTRLNRQTGALISTPNTHHWGIKKNKKKQ